MNPLPRPARALAIMALLSLSVFAGIAIGGSAQTKPVNPVQEARQWVAHFKGITIERVRRELGKPTTEKQWKSNGAEGPLLIYEFTPESKLQLFVHNGEVASVLLTVQSK
jgi:hypothetical protein